MMKHVHFIGIGGTGLSAIAMVLLERGIVVSGSDQQISPMARRLKEKGVNVNLGHDPENIAGADVVIRSSAISEDNPEVQAALKAGIPVLKRVDFLDQLIADQKGIAVAGTHGKTTTTAMIAWMLFSLGYDPSYVIGGESKNLGNNAHAGQGQYFVIEADEYDRMFLGISPSIAIITNIEHDHPDCFPTSDEFFQAFDQFVDRIQQDGILLACIDDPGVQHLINRGVRTDIQLFTYGRESDANFSFLDPTPNNHGGFTFIYISRESQEKVTVSLKVPGLHNIYNAVASISVANLLNRSLSEAASTLHRFEGTGRRFDVVGEVNGITFVDDYAHHPTEIKATLAAARSRYQDRRLWVVWQPHTYSRTRSLYDQFLGAFGEADCLLITEIYGARESAPEDGFSAALIARAVDSISLAKPGSIHFLPDLELTRDFLLSRLEPGDVVLVLSAGDAHRINAELLKSLLAGKSSPVEKNVLLPGFNKERE